MWYQIGVVLVVVLFLVYVAAAFGKSLGALLINGAIIFLIAYRAYFEIKAGRARQHVVAALLAFLIVLLLGNIGKPFWLFTTFLIIEYVLSVIVQLIGRQSPELRKYIAPGRLEKHTR